MHKAENRLVIPSEADDSEEETIMAHLQNAGFLKTDSEWLVDVFKRRDCFGDPTGTSVFRDKHDNYEHGDFGDALSSSLAFKELVQIAKNGQTSLALLFSMMLNFGPRYNTVFSPNVPLKESNESSDIPQWVSELQRRAQFNAESLDWKKLIETTQFDKLLPFLFPDGVPLNQIVDLDLLDSVQPGGSNNDFNDPQQLGFWLTLRLSAEKERCHLIRLDTLLQDFSTFPDNVLGDKFRGLYYTIRRAMTYASAGTLSQKRLNPVGDGWEVVAHELIPFFELLNARKPELNQERSPLLKTWWHLAVYIFSWGYGGLESELSDELKSRLIESASRHIGILRSVLRDSPEDFEDADVLDFYDKAYYVLLSFASPWKRLKPLLLAFTEITEQAVARDLRTWREHDSTDNPPPIYSRVPNWIEVAMYPQNLKSELKKDSYLQNLREEFAKFCLERLRTKIKNKDSGYTDEDFVEPRPAWRRCYVQALAALRVNPGGRAHRTLFWLLNNDPDETVREFAKKAHKRVRHLDRNKPNLDEGASPRRPLFEAFWWLRQAHLITLGIEIDQAGAMRTRRKELHRTREKDDRFK